MLYKKGDVVKIRDTGERFWVKITYINGNKIRGNVENILVNTHDFKFGDNIEFEKYDILEQWN